MTHALHIENLRKTYAGGFEALKGIDLIVESGDFFALLGPNGAGKTTAIGIIASLVTKSAGQVSVFGHDIDAAPELAKRCLGLVPQEFNFNVFEPIEDTLINQAGYYGIDRAEARERSGVRLNQLGLWGKRRDTARQLSGGMKRRLMIARALVHDPKLLILDEPTAGVDIEIRRSTWKFLNEINSSGTTIILTTHYLEEAEALCRNIAIINHGFIAENTGMKALLSRLHVQTIVLTLLASLAQTPDLKGFPAKLVDDSTLEVALRKDQTMNQLFAELDRSKIKVSSMRNKSNRLEELFIKLVDKEKAGGTA